MSRQFLAFDLGAQSGRAILGRLSSGVLDVREIHRFANEPLRDDTSLRWNASGLWSEIRRGLDAARSIKLESVGVDSWGVDYALLGDRGDLLENPYHYRDRRTQGAMEALAATVGRERIYEITGIQFLPINTLVQLYAACRATPDVIRSARTLLAIADWFNYRLTGRLVRGVHAGHDDAVPRRATTRRGRPICWVRLACPRRSSLRSSNRAR